MPFVLDFSNPVVQTYLVPLLAAAASVGLVRFFLGPIRGALLAGVGIGIGYLAAHLLLQGLPAWPPAGALDTLPFIVFGGILIGGLMDELDNPEGLMTPLFVSLPIMVLFWLGLSYFSGFKDLPSTAPFAVIMVAGIVALQILHRERDDGTASPVSLLAALTGLAAIAHFSGKFSPSYATAMAMATMGFIAWNWPRTRQPWGTAGTLSVGGCYLALATMMIMSDMALAIPVAVSFLVFFVPPIVERVFMPKQSAAPFLQALVSLAPIGGAAILTLFLA